MAFTYSKLASTTVGAGGTSAITFSNIPQNYTDLVLKFSLRDNSASAWNNLSIKFNGSTSSYSARSVVGTGTGTTSQSSTTDIDRQYTNGNTTTANTFGNGEIYIPNYTSSVAKSLSSDTVGENNSSTSIVGLMAGLWNNVTAISSLSLSAAGASFLQYSTATLYGIRVEL